MFCCLQLSCWTFRSSYIIFLRLGYREVISRGRQCPPIALWKIKQADYVNLWAHGAFFFRNRFARKYITDDIIEMCVLIVTKQHMLSLLLLDSLYLKWKQKWLMISNNKVDLAVNLYSNFVPALKKRVVFLWKRWLNVFIVSA